jgi:hypothetical protein
MLGALNSSRHWAATRSSPARSSACVAMKAWQSVQTRPQIAIIFSIKTSSVWLLLSRFLNQILPDEVLGARFLQALSLALCF